VPAGAVELRYGAVEQSDQASDRARNRSRDRCQQLYSDPLTGHLEESAVPVSSRVMLGDRLSCAFTGLRGGVRTRPGTGAACRCGRRLHVGFFPQS
jgi:hypothetical protein